MQDSCWYSAFAFSLCLWIAGKVSLSEFLRLDTLNKRVSGFELPSVNDCILHLLAGQVSLPKPLPKCRGFSLLLFAFKMVSFERA